MVLLLALLVGYPLSIGPAVMIVGASGCNDTIANGFQLVYAPLSFAPILGSLLGPWIEFWDIYGIMSSGAC